VGEQKSVSCGSPTENDLCGAMFMVMMFQIFTDAIAKNSKIIDRQRLPCACSKEVEAGGALQVKHIGWLLQ
jgi:hypothetical protein